MNETNSLLIWGHKQHQKCHKMFLYRRLNEQQQNFNILSCIAAV